MVRRRWGIWGVGVFLLSLAPSRVSALSSAFEISNPFRITASDIKIRDGFSYLPTFDQSISASPGEPSIAWLPFSLADVAAPDDLALEIIKADTIQLSFPLAPAQRDLMTSDTATVPSWMAPDLNVYEVEAWFPKSNLRVIETGQMHGHEIVLGAWSPFRYHPPTRQLVIISEALINSSNRTVASGESTAAPARIADALLETTMEAPESLSRSLSAGASDAAKWITRAGVPLDVEYVVITRAAFVNDIKPLVLWKARKGIRSGIAKLEDILLTYPEVDAAASVRSYIRAAYASGLRWVVLGGDETVAPVRLAYADFPAYDGDPHKLQQCDLYFAELDGEWDADGDGVWGEFFGDQAQLTPELYVGRLPFSTGSEARTIVNKIIAYERGPASASYLTRALSTSTDQFRDWNDGAGQHAAVAAAMPPAWTHDLSTMIEAPSGEDPVPTYPGEATFLSAMQQGFGWVNYFAHGRVDAFTVRSSGLNNWPRVLVMTEGSAGDGNAHLNLLTSATCPGIHLSAACDQGGFDLNSPPYSDPAGKSVAERLLLVPNGGAAAFIGQSRWGWVSSSYRLIQKFYEYVGNPATPNHVGVYQTLAKLAFGSYRDLVFGNNLHGDPEMPVWKTLPSLLNVAAPEAYQPGTSTWTLQVTGSSGGVSGVLVTVSIGDSVWTLGQTASDGRLVATVTLPSAPEAIVTATKPEYRVWVDTLAVSIVAGVFDDDVALPSSPLLISNYPNPFNAATVLTFSLSVDGPVAVEVFDVLGQRRRILLSDVLSAGEHRMSFDGRDDANRELASGVYFARMTVGPRTMLRKIVLLR